MTQSKGIAYQKGRYLSVDDACIGILDPAFTKSDVVFDALSFADGNFFRLADHVERFHASCAFVRLKPPVSDDEMVHIMAQCAHRSGLPSGLLFMLCTRGRYADGNELGDPRTCVNEFIAYSVPYFSVIPKERTQTGGHLWIAETRRAPDAAINQRCKNFNRMDLTRAQFEALDAGADAPVLLSMEGYLTEGPGFNVWIIKNRKARTPGENMLEGITRRTVFDLCQSIGIEAEAADLRPKDLTDADEVFISSTGGGIIPITRVNDRPIGNGAPGLATCQLRDLYWEKRKAGWHATPIAGLLVAPTPSAAAAV